MSTQDGRTMYYLGYQPGAEPRLDPKDARYGVAFRNQLVRMYPESRDALIFKPFMSCSNAVWIEYEDTDERSCERAREINISVDGMLWDEEARKELGLA